MYEYGECINRFIENLTNGSIFETEQVARAVAKKYGIELHHAKSVTNNQLKRLTDAGHIDRIQKGVYYKTPNTVFGKVLPNLEAYAIQLLTIQNQQRIGYGYHPHLEQKHLWKKVHLRWSCLGCWQCSRILL